MIAAEKTLKFFGPPGTGKTTTLLDVLEREINNGIPPERIAYLTFTRVARKEAVDRVVDRFGFDPVQLKYFKTLHAICYHSLGVGGNSMVKNTKDLEPLADLLNVKFGKLRLEVDEGLGLITGAEEGDKLLAFEHFRRHNMWTIEQAYRHWQEEMSLFEVRRFAQTYEAWKENEDRLDFTDLLVRADEALPVDIVIVDEAQDLSRLQWAALDRLSRNAYRLYLAGDDDQAIFTWAGASPETFIKRPGAVRVLDQSWRLPRAVFKVADRISRGIQVRQPKTWRPRDEEGSVNHLMSADHMSIGAEGSYLVLYRNHWLAGDIEDQLRSDGVPYAKNDMPAPGAEWAAAIWHWEHLRRGKAVALVEALEVYNAMVSGRQLTRGAKARLQRCNDDQPITIERLKKEFGLLTEAPWFEALGKLDENQSRYLRRVIKHHGSAALVATPRVRLSTIHGSKGAQADHVILLTDMSRKTRETLEREPDVERRVFYVGATRAKQSLTLVGMDNPIF